MTAHHHNTAGDPRVSHESLPFAPADQAAVERVWQSMLRHPESRAGAADLSLEPLRMRVQASWRRSRLAGVSALLPCAPMVLDEHALDATRSGLDWVRSLRDVLAQQRHQYFGQGHMLAVFDAHGHMLEADGDPRALEQLAEINFRPGALWSEDAVGTNGPGTALALERAVHIVGAEHYCASWQQWHCASVPVRDPVTQRVLGVVDLSGHRNVAHPYALTLATAIAIALEQRLGAREAEGRAIMLEQYAELVGRYPGDAVLAVDRAGRTIARSCLDRDLTREIGAMLTSAGCTEPYEFVHPALGGARGVVHPVLRDGRAIAACLVMARNTNRRQQQTGTAPTGEARPTDARAGQATGSASGTHRRRSAHAPGNTFTAVRYTLDDLVGASTTMHDVRRLARACARTDLPVLLLGESGTGKEVLAQAIHHASPRRDKPFVPVNCAALPRELLESELFGYATGAFSGARRDGAHGKFDAANGGTLFLDEVAELPPDAQAALLRVLEEGEVTRLGETMGRRIDVRIIAATNRNIADAVATGRLRDDLYHRLDVLSITVPPLRERADDIPRLAAHFLAVANADQRIPRWFAPGTLAILSAYTWPGNVRELRNVVQRAVALAEHSRIDPTDVPLSLQRVTPVAPPREREGANDADRRALIAAIEAHDTVTAAAASLGITRSTLYRRLQRYGLSAARATRERS